MEQQLTLTRDEAERYLDRVYIWVDTPADRKQREYAVKYLLQSSPERAEEIRGLLRSKSNLIKV